MDSNQFENIILLYVGAVLFVFPAKTRVLEAINIIETFLILF